ncbi:DUF885 domain-containing protein [Erysipelothrix sp. strain 2 (EsS2-7-Brazil)]|uniref:DUF885 domain-containing protein n=1 Tax=Erysipelothrix sp. strain 2 (EsS2-7-Brazil) TaxID=2500579 RepID=UPI001909FFCC|nr:DUF885 domain-containing protein [Erysipelothrix sp. strain 2 (EsS2-7-Brazil)]MBK2404315.1 DUF885 domain-containing protein [Erysipelothrix sp. strain 2 (EsS2-7-Brazil)]
MKKTLTILIILINLFGCQFVSSPSDDGTNKDFESALDTALVSMIGSTDPSSNYLLEHPEDYDVDVEHYAFRLGSEEDFEMSKDLIKDIEKNIRKFKDRTLSDQQIIDKRVLLYELERMASGYQPFQFQVDPELDSIPQYLEGFTFRTKSDIIGYFSLIDSIPSYFDESIAFYNKTEMMTQYEHETLTEFATIMKEQSLSDDFFLIKGFDTKVESAPFLNQSEKTVYIEQNREMIRDVFYNAFVTLENELKTIKTRPNRGLAHLENGKTYYETLIPSLSGRNQTIPEFQMWISNRRIEVYQRLKDVESSNKLLEYQEFEANQTSPKYQDAYALIDDLYLKSKNDFPEIPAIPYKVHQIDPSLEAISNPAFYYVPPIDSEFEHTQRIYINSAFDPANFTTFAHEAIPGHMYQTQYMRSIQGMHPIRLYIRNNAMTEGWAQYVEQLSIRYLGGPEGYEDYIRDLYESMYLILLEVDIGIHYNDWSREEMGAFFDSVYVNNSESERDEIYRQIILEPGNIWSYYYGAMSIQSMKERAQRELGDAFDEKAFHKIILDLGSASFDTMETIFNEYLHAQ